MLTMTLATWLLAATPTPVEASLELQPIDTRRLALALCFKGSGQRVRFRLLVRSSGAAGNSQTAQSGTLVAGEAPQCPLRNRFGIAADSRVEAELQWWIDEAEQPAILRSYPDDTGSDDEQSEQHLPEQIA
ncbi:hypothetical protein [Pseudomonas lopnurensis]|uniref:hypothetical protein n=1 Tax=Pseudomonas lopnurensis TaxID=1477517 RepID=UPI0028A5E487|nr:hypothetical protein [Pseudomonas lopnurensis]